MIRIYFAVTCLLIGNLLTADDVERLPSYMGRGLGADGRTETRTAIRTFKHASGKGPTILLVGVAHLGEANYYENLQTRLNACDLVLYEGVGRPQFMTEHADKTRDPRGWTRSAINYLADIVVWFRDEIGSLPDSLRKLRLAIRLHNPKELAWFDRIMNGPEGWTVQLTTTQDACTIRYLANRKKSAKPQTAEPKAVVTMDTRDSNADGLQKQLADALNLQFQMDAIDYSSPNFVNSDLTLSQLRARMRGNDAPTTSTTKEQSPSNPHVHTHEAIPSSDDNDLELLIKRLQGNDPAVKLAMTMTKGLLANSETGRELVKWVLGEALVNAERLIDGLPTRDNPSLAGTAALMQVLIQDRNAAVISDLKRILKEQPELKTIAVFYGAAHMADMHTQLEKELGFKVTATDWQTVFSADREKAGITVDQANQIRRAIKEQLK